MLSSSILNRFYYKSLNEGFGIGKNPVTQKDYILSYLGQNENYLNYGSQNFDSKNLIRRFVGILNTNGTVTAGQMTKYFDNDQKAYQAGLVKGDCYYLSQTNTYGLPMGIPKIITEDEE